MIQQSSQNKQNEGLTLTCFVKIFSYYWMVGGGGCYKILNPIRTL